MHLRLIAILATISLIACQGYGLAQSPAPPADSGASDVRGYPERFLMHVGDKVFWTYDDRCATALSNTGITGQAAPAPDAACAKQVQEILEELRMHPEPPLASVVAHPLQTPGPPIR